MSDDTPSKLAGIFKAHNERVAGAGSAAEQQRTMQKAGAVRAYEHLTKIVVPELQRLAALINTNGQKASVNLSRSEREEPIRAEVKMSIVPRGHENARADDVPWISFNSGFGGIGTQVHAVFPGKGGTSSGGEYFADLTQLTASKVEALVLDLIEKTFDR